MPLSRLTRPTSAMGGELVIEDQHQHLAWVQADFLLDATERLVG